MKKIRTIIVAIFVVVMCTLAANGAYAATYYVSINGSDSNSGTSVAPWKTFSKAFSVMAGGDTLIVKNGTYNYAMIDPPSGSPGQYTVIKAENDGGAIIDGQHSISVYPGSVLNINNRSYIRVEGFKFVNGGENVITIWGGSHHIELKRVGAGNANAMTTYAIVISMSGNDILLEDVWAWGGARKLIVSGGNNVILRRVVVRWDFHTSSTSVPRSGIAFYDGTNSICENCIALDFNQHPGAYGAIRGPHGAINNKFIGNIILNVKGFVGFWPSEWDKGDIYNSVVWDVPLAGVRAGSNGGIIDQITIGNSNEPVVAYGTPPSGKNSIFFNNSGSTMLGENNYNLYFNTPIQSGAANVLTADPKLKYILRSECATNPGLPQCGSGEGGKDRGANILYRYVNGVQTNVPLWPWPNEDRIKADMCAPNTPPSGAIPAVNDTTRGFCSKSSLTEYIWTYLGNPNPYSGYATPVVPGPPVNLVVK